MINLHGPVDTYRTDTTMLAPDSSFKNIPQLPAMYLSQVKPKVNTCGTAGIGVSSVYDRH